MPADRILAWSLVGTLWATHLFAQTPYRMQGVVTDADTRQPVAGATVQVLIESERIPKQRIRKGVTDAAGAYSIELPAGHAWAWHLMPPAGYCPAKNHDVETFATTAEKPVFTKDYQVGKGIAIRVMAMLPGNRPVPQNTYFSLGQQGDKPISSFCELDDNGRGTINLPGIEGRFSVYCADEQRALVTPEEMSVEYEKGFDPGHVKSQTRMGDGTQVVHDANGRTATVRGCLGMIGPDGMTIAVEATLASTDEAKSQLVGRVINAAGNGVAGVALRVAFHSGGGSAASGPTADTDAAGHFAIALPKLRAGQKVSLVVTADRFGGIDTKPTDVAAGVADLGNITLEPGASVRVQVVGPDGSPAHGALVEPSNDYASRTRIARTDAQGHCLLTDLSAGRHRISARFGNMTKSATVPLDRGENELVVIKLSPPRTEAAATAVPERRPALAAGAPCPEWEISEWSDGQQRKFADYKGKVVVLDFWGIWCGPCIHAIPAMKELHERFKTREVTFLGIHTAGTDMTLIKRLLKQQEWDLVTGLDTGDDIVTGKTVERFAIHGFPTVMVIDANGRIAFNSSDNPKDREAFMRQMQTIAEAARIPWPIDKDANEEEVARRMTRLQVAMFGAKIEEALKIKPD